MARLAWAVLSSSIRSPKTREGAAAFSCHATAALVLEKTLRQSQLIFPYKVCSCIPPRAKHFAQGSVRWWGAAQARGGFGSHEERNPMFSGWEEGAPHRKIMKKSWKKPSWVQVCPIMAPGWLIGSGDAECLEVAPAANTRCCFHQGLGLSLNRCILARKLLVVILPRNPVASRVRAGYFQPPEASSQAHKAQGRQR